MLLNIFVFIVFKVNSYVMSGDLSNAMNRVSLAPRKKRIFAFSPIFDAKKFYDKYETADFLVNKQNVRIILAKTHDLQEQYDKIQPDEEMVIKGMFLRPNVPLVLKKSATLDEIDVSQDDFTLRRLCGLAASIVFQRNKEFKHIYAVDSERYKLRKPYNNGLYVSDSCDIAVYSSFEKYLAAVTGAEFYTHYFDFYPFLMALKKFNSKHIDAPLLISIANMRHPDTQQSLALRCYRHFKEAVKVAKEHYGFDLKEVLRTAPKEIQLHFQLLLK